MHHVNAHDGMYWMISWFKRLRGLRLRFRDGTLALTSRYSPIAVGHRVYHYAYGFGVVCTVGISEYVVIFDSGFRSSTYKMYCCRVLCSLGWFTLAVLSELIDEKVSKTFVLQDVRVRFSETVRLPDVVAGGSQPWHGRRWVLLLGTSQFLAWFIRLGVGALLEESFLP